MVVNAVPILVVIVNHFRVFESLLHFLPIYFVVLFFFFNNFCQCAIGLTLTSSHSQVPSCSEHEKEHCLMFLVKHCCPHILLCKVLDYCIAIDVLQPAALFFINDAANTPLFFNSTIACRTQNPLSRTSTFPPPQIGIVRRRRVPIVLP